MNSRTEWSEVCVLGSPARGSTRVCVSWGGLKRSRSATYWTQRGAGRRVDSLRSGEGDGARRMFVRVCVCECVNV